MTGTFSAFDEERNEPARDICTVQAPHAPHTWVIDYAFHGKVDYSCPGDLGYEYTTIPTKEDISND